MRTTLIVTVAALAGLLVGCAQTSTHAKPYEPVTVATPAASGAPKVVTFTEESARRAGVELAKVERDGDLLVVPSTALIYDKSGAVVVFTADSPLTYRRAPVTLTRDTGVKAWLSKGPAAGTLVVTIGANQVWGAEQGVGH
ncbi:MAG: hypothetical protein WAS07_15735 [Micropruina sp.]|nr:hypothetical protein [Micropruina sp.]